MDLPKEITPCPIVDAILEIRFDSLVANQAILGILFNELKESDNSKILNLPISQLPENIRETDSALKFSPSHQFTINNYKIQIGFNVLVIGFPIPYSNWSSIFSELKKIIEKIEITNVIKKVNRIGLRTIDFFDFDIFTKVKLQVINDTEDFTKNNLTLISEINKNSYINILQITNNAGFRNKTGSIIDIDTIKEIKPYNKLTDICDDINEAHNTQKSLFFNLLKKEYLDSLNPKY